MTPRDHHLLTPGLTTLHAARLRDALWRLTGLPTDVSAQMYADADRLAGRYLMSPHAADHQGATCTVTQLSESYPHDTALISYIAGLAFGVRLGRQFVPPPKPRSKAWISEDYRQLREDNRRTVAKVVRQLLRAQDAPRTRPTHPSADAAAAREWIKKAGHAARHGTPP